jgi:hypothetical protein
MKRTLTALLIGVVLLLGLPAMLAAGGQGEEGSAEGEGGQAEMPKFVTITSGPTGGGWYMLGGTLSDLVTQEVGGVKVNVTTGGSLANLTKVDSGDADIGLTMDRLFYEARNGIESYEEAGVHENVAGMAYLGDIYMSLFLVRQGYQADSIREIKEKQLPIRLLTSPKASSPALAAERMLAEYDISFDDIESWGGKVNFVSYAEASSLIKDGHADAWCGPMVSAIVELTVSRKMKILPVEEEVLDSLAENYKYGKSTIPEDNWYFISQPTPTMTEAVIFIASTRLPADFIYEVTAALCENPERVRAVSKTYSNFSPDTAMNIVGGPLHPGAERYYEEQ